MEETVMEETVMEEIETVKDSLKSDFGVIDRNGSKGVVVLDTALGDIFIPEKGQISGILNKFVMFDNDLLYLGENNNGERDESKDIMKIYHSRISNGDFKVDWDRPVWVRQDTDAMIQNILNAMNENNRQNAEYMRELHEIGGDSLVNSIISNTLEDVLKIEGCVDNLDAMMQVVDNLKPKETNDSNFFDGPTCKGSLRLGTGCGHCSKCMNEAKEMEFDHFGENVSVRIYDEDGEAE